MGMQPGGFGVEPYMPMVHPKSAGCRSCGRPIPRATACTIEAVGVSSGWDLRVRVQQGGPLSSILGKPREESESLSLPEDAL